ncbi:hypothetical protein G6L68_25355 [Agrobacterium fabrum]|uniref:hypothetical protein n=1 Tax=Agrobacterium fabrum TaxID=1176649 RepID=UPI000EF59235|nr:hypothetical protein [Agrobacterium fabrum]AYM66217.1 hypothetical protein At12D13_50650 [Agrobacterium fabrum]NTE63962.1 hypothetical protein [Agrobacterium fabrum]
MTPEIDAHLEKVKAEAKKRNRDNLTNTAIASIVGAGLAYWAWHTVAHAAFGFSLFFTVTAVGNRVSYELFQLRAQQKASELLDKAGM